MVSKIGRQLADECKRQGLSTAALSRVTGISRKQLDRLFRTVRHPHAASVIAIGYVLGLRVLPRSGNAVDINVLPEVLAGDAKRRNYTLRELATMSGRSHTTVRTLLLGDGSWATCCAVMEALGWKVLWPKLSLEAARRRRIENDKF